MYTTTKYLRDCRLQARTILSNVFISAIQNVQGLRNFDDSVESVRRKISRPKLSNTIKNVTTIDDLLPQNDTNQLVSIEKPGKKRGFNAVTDGRRAIIAMIDRIWCIPYAPSQYIVQFMCTVSLIRMKRHKYCVRWQNNRRSAIFYVNIDENDNDTTVWVNFPDETKSHRPHTSHAHFHRFLHRNLF